MGQVNGLNSGEGLAINCKGGNGANARTLAHEIGHACKLDDIYNSDPNNGINTPDSLAKEEWAPKDWNNGPGAEYYKETRKQSELVRQLLMYGEFSNTKADIPLGRVYGVQTQDYKNYSLGLTLVGMKDSLGAQYLERSPIHQ
jgi:hypothetical protein